MCPLEETRARRVQRLREATRLAHRSVELGLSVRDDEAEHERQVEAALAPLDRELGIEEPPPALPAAGTGAR